MRLTEGQKTVHARLLFPALISAHLEVSVQTGGMPLLHLCGLIDSTTIETHFSGVPPATVKCWLSTRHKHHQGNLLLWSESLCPPQIHMLEF